LIERHEQPATWTVNRPTIVFDAQLRQLFGQQRRQFLVCGRALPTGQWLAPSGADRAGHRIAQG
jgi:hypothetical protein